MLLYPSVSRGMSNARLRKKGRHRPHGALSTVDALGVALIKTDSCVWGAGHCWLHRIVRILIQEFFRG